MALITEFLPLQIGELSGLAARKKEQGWRFVQILAVNTDHGIDVQYTFFKDACIENYTLVGVTKEQTIPSITDVFLAAFVFENEVHDLFGVNIEGIAIDFGGAFYALSQPEPMTIISPAQKAAREKAAKIAAAKAAKEQAARTESAPSAPSEADLEAKLAAMDPEKAAKVRAAMEAKKRKLQEAKDKVFEEKLAAMDPEKAAKVRAAVEAKKKKERDEQNKAASAKEGE